MSHSVTYTYGVVLSNSQTKTTIAFSDAMLARSERMIQSRAVDVDIHVIIVPHDVFFLDQSVNIVFDITELWHKSAL